MQNNIPSSEDIGKLFKKRVNEIETQDKEISLALRDIKEDNINVNNPYYGYRSSLRFLKNQNSIDRKIKAMYLKLWNEGLVEFGQTYICPYWEDAKKIKLLEKELMDSYNADIVHDRAVDLLKKSYKQN